MAPTPTSITSHGAATRLAMGVAVRRLQLVLVHRCTCSADRCVSVLQETQAAHRTRMMPRGGVAGDTWRDAARHPHSHRAECCCRKYIAPRCEPHRLLLRVELRL
jgi:hypothetical protein